ncbi:MAG TPA: exodeoxyribonuclease VII large subunit, partial [Spirochaetota bacterium]|nr:exodeoxyribonuclease VII large subunit [Spirochaetota bacterium]
MDRVLTVSECAQIVKRRIEGAPDLTSIWVRGEISNITYHSSGHIYFTLKDPNAILQAVFFKSVNRGLKFKLEEGLAIIAFGSITTYEKRGNYQMVVADVSLEGIGALQKQIEQLKKKLSAEGLFDPARKRKIPFLPKRIGVVTSPTGAAFRDILKVALRRYPTIEIILAPAKVQGDDAAATIVRGIEELNRPEWGIDVIIAGRGGGSFEDLMPFNEEPVVRAFATSRIPVISAVGHQIDHPLSDDAADMYAPTPSAAAELAVPLKSELIAEIDMLHDKALAALEKRIERDRNRISNVLARRVFAEPSHIVYMKEIELSDIKNRMVLSLKDMISDARARMSAVPDITKEIRGIVERKRNALAVSASAVESLSPLGVIARGYAVAINSEKKVVKSVKSVRTGDTISLFLSDGKADCEILSLHEGVTLGKEKE